MVCGRYLIEDEDYEIEEIIAAAKRNAQDFPQEMAFAPGEIFPGSLAPVITAGGAARFMIWGFPNFAAQRRPHINARSETAATLRTFGAAMASRRCLVPASGYYEWKSLGAKRKEKYAFRLPGGAALYMAGIYSPDGKFAILTREAAPELAEIHDRMPVILPKELSGAWLDESPDVMLEAVTQLLYAVSTNISEKGLPGV